MSTNRGRGRGRGQGTKSQPPIEAPATLETEDFSPPQATVPQEPVQSKPRRVQPKSADELRRIMDIIQSRIIVIIDSLEGDDNEISLKRNVATAVKHLKQINTLLG